MLHVSLPIVPGRKLPFYLATEEWIARNLPQDEYFFSWQVDNTVICGRNQDIPKEVNLDFCRDNSIEVYRRKSGGGAVFADMNNIMFSYIAPEAAVQTAFNSYTSKVAKALCNLGLDARASGRNDILIGDKKVAGNAYWQCNGRSIVHGTMLYDTDVRLMSGALTPSRAKLESNKVVSVPSRITTIRSYLPYLTIDDFMSHILTNICDRKISVGMEALPEIENLEQEYYHECFEIGESVQKKVQRIDGVGSIAIEIRKNNGHIENVLLSGDFFTLADSDSALLRLKGVPPERHEIFKALGAIPLIAGLSNKELAAIIADTEC